MFNARSKIIKKDDVSLIGFRYSSRINDAFFFLLDQANRPGRRVRKVSFATRDEQRRTEGSTLTDLHQQR